VHTKIKSYKISHPYENPIKVKRKGKNVKPSGNLYKKSPEKLLMAPQVINIKVGFF
jgi:hypothetical protein